MAKRSDLPRALDETLVGTYPALVGAGGGFVWDAVLEYRVWCHPERGAPDLDSGSDYYYAFPTYDEALEFADGAVGAEEPIALILQKEYIDEPEPGLLVHVKEPRMTEWPVHFLETPRRTASTIPDRLALGAAARRSFVKELN
jgi:hypothetical protein